MDDSADCTDVYDEDTAAEWCLTWVKSTGCIRVSNDNSKTLCVNGICDWIDTYVIPITKWDTVTNALVGSNPMVVDQ